MARRPTTRYASVLGVLALASVAVVGPSGTAAATAARSTAAPARVFSPHSPWNTRIPASARLDPDSQAMVTGLVTEAAAEEAGDRGPWINTNAWSVPVYTVGS